MHPENFDTSESNLVVTFRDVNDGHIQCIKAHIGAYDNDPLSERYAAEYYYSWVEGVYRLRFVFVYNANYSEEYRIYLTDDQKCIRYIGPYESQETTYDYETPIEIAELITKTSVAEFCNYGIRELHWYGVY